MMSLGAGLLLSTILLILVWQIDKRCAWRRAAKICLWVTAVVAIIGLSSYLYFGWWPDLQVKKAHAKEIERVRNPTDFRYWGVSPDMTKNEVRYLKGDPPQTVPASKDGAAEERWVYTFGEPPIDYVYTVFWNAANSRIQAVICDGNAPANCEKLAGIGPGDDEADVRATLGKPDEDRSPDDRGRKTLVYGKGPKRIFILLSRGKVDGLVFARLRKFPYPQ